MNIVIPLFLFLFYFLIFFKGNALGFKLDGLTKLRDVKTSDNKGSLLHVLVSVLEVRNPDTLGFFQEMPAVEEARKGP